MSATRLLPSEVPAGTALESHDHDTNNYHYEIGYKWPSDDTSALIGTAQTLTGLQLTIFRGCYRSTHFTIGEDAPSQPPPPVEPPTTSPSAKLLPGCAHIAKESAYCMALLEGGDVRLAMVGLDSGQLCSGSTAKNLQASGNASLGWIGDKVYACSRDGVVEINIADGATRVANVSCEAVTTHGSEILVMGFGGGIKSYASFDDVLKDKAGKTYNISGVFASRIAARDGQLVFAWHSTNEVQLAPLRDGATVSKLPLAGYDDWVDGLDIVGGKLVVGTPFRVGGIRLFDLATGKHLKTLNVGGTNVFYPGVAGIRCAAGAGS